MIKPGLKEGAPAICDIIKAWYKPAWVVSEWEMIHFHEGQIPHCRLEATIGCATVILISMWPTYENFNYVETEYLGGKRECISFHEPNFFEKIEADCNSRSFELAEFAVNHRRNYPNS